MGDTSTTSALTIGVGQLLSLIFYGIYLVVFGTSMHYLAKRRRDQNNSMNRLIAIANVFLMLLITTHMGIISRMSLVPFFGGNEKDAAQAVILANSNADPVNSARQGLWVVQMSLSSFLMIYRLWVIWQRNWAVILLPACGLISYIVCESIFLRHTVLELSAKNAGKPLPYTLSQEVDFLYAGLGCDVFGSIYCTSLISYKIWRAQRLTRQTTTHLKTFSSSNIIAIFVESAALYTICILILLIAFTQGTSTSHGSSPAYLVFDAFVPIGGIAYSIIIVRFGMGGAFNNGPQLTTFNIPGPAQHPDTQGLGHSALQKAVVHFQQRTDTDTTLDQGSDRSVDNEFEHKEQDSERSESV